MANSKKLPRSKPDLLPCVAAFLHHHISPGARLVVALSGGVDSVALLDLLARLRRPLQLKLGAVHVNHQLSPNASQWERFCRKLCRARRVPLRVARVVVQRGDSLEDAARRARYRVLAAQRAAFVALAHHRDDQAETLLLQLLRGAGVKGLAAMPEVRAGGGAAAPQLLRPLLDVSRSEIERYAAWRGLEWVEDESNADVYYDRNFLRREVLPLIERRYPAARATLARSARHLAEASGLLDELAALDAAEAVHSCTLDVGLLRRLGKSRAKNLLRFFLARQEMAMPSAARLDEILRQVVGARRDAAVAMRIGDRELRRFAGRLHAIAPGSPPPTWQRAWNGRRGMALAELGGKLVFAPARGRGISRRAMVKGRVELRLRSAGERLRPDCRRPRRNLKALYQAAGVAPWERARLPLIFIDGVLAAVPGVGIDCAFQAQAGEPGYEPHWIIDR